MNKPLALSRHTTLWRDTPLWRGTPLWRTTSFERLVKSSGWRTASGTLSSGQRCAKKLGVKYHILHQNSLGFMSVKAGSLHLNCS